MASLSLRGIYKRYPGGVVAVSDFTMNIKDKEFIVLVGPSGCGKTTLLKMIGITYIGQFSSGICRDAGYSSTGAQIELFCRLSVMVLSMPVLLALLDTIQGFLA